MSEILRDVIGDYDGFVGDINRGLEIAGIDRSELGMCDHICYRVETNQRYRELAQKLGRFADMIGEVEVGGRPISTFELYEPIEVGGWAIPCIELPAPKEKSFYKEGLEHAEFVVLGSLGGFQKQHRELVFNEKAKSKQINPEISLKTPLMSVKFHEIPLGAVVRLEGRLGKI